MSGILDFFSRERGQERTRALNEGVMGLLSEYLGPTGIPDRLAAVNQILNPVVGVSQAATHTGNALDPSKSGRERALSAGQGLLEVAGVVAPGAAYRFSGQTADDAARAVEEVFAGISTAPSAVAGREFGASESGIFAGINAKNADLDAMDRAKRMADEGASRDDIWNATGWFKGADDKWRFEIDDSAIDLLPMGESQMTADAMRNDAKSMILGIKERNAALKVQPDLFPADLRRANGETRRAAENLTTEANSNFGPEWHHSTNGQRATYAFSGPLQEQYPDIMRETIVRTGSPSQAYSGSYNGQANKLDVSSNAQEPRSVALHELQHMVQDAEGFARGSNLSEGERIARERVHSASMAKFNQMRQDVDALPPEEKAAFLKFEQDPDAPFAKEAFRLMSPRTRKVVEQWDTSDRLARSAGNVSTANARAFYRRHAGEAEARNVQARMDMTPKQRRESPPWTTQDTPDTAQLLRYGNTASASELSPEQDQAQGILDLLSQGKGSDVTDDMMARADDQYLFNNYDLPMDEASRMARAQEMGFDTDAPLYHGTTAAEDFSALNPSERGKIGPGVYMTPNKNRAGVFAGADQASILAKEDALPNSRVLPLLATNSPADEAARFEARGLRDGYDGNHIAAYQDAFGKRGFDGVSVADERTILDPSNIRSRFARFDPRLAHLRNLSAGLASVGLLDLLTPEERKGLLQ